MKIVVSPLLGSEGLDGGVCGGRAGHEDAKQRGIEGVDVVEVHDVCLASQQLTHGIGAAHDNAKSQEHQQVGVREDVDELRYRVVGRHTFQELALANPALRNLVASHLDPDGINRVGRNSLYLCNNNSLTLSHIHGIEGHIAIIVGQWQQVSAYQEVVILRIVVCRRKRYRVELLLAEII